MLLALAISVLGFAQSPAASETADRYLDVFLAANGALEANGLPRAKQLFERALELRPENPTCAYDLACVAARSGDPKSSLDWLARAVDWDYVDADVALWDADLAPLRTANEFQLALDAMKSRAASAPPSLVTRIDWGVDRSALTCTDDPVASGDGKTLAIALRSGTSAITTTIVTIDLEHARRLGAFDLPIDSAVELVRAPDGGVRVVSASGNVLQVRDALRGAVELEFALQKHAGRIHSISVSPDLTHLALDGNEIGRVLVDLRAKQIVESLPIDASLKPTWVWSADSSVLACLEGKTRVHLVRADDGREVRAPIESVEVYWLAFDRDAKRIAIGGRNNPLRVFEIDSATPPKELTLYECDSVFAWHEMNATWVGFSPDGDILAAMSSRSDYVFGWNGCALDPRWCDGNREDGHGKAGTRAQFGAITNRLFVSFPARVLDGRDGSSLADLSAPPNTSLGCTPDERFLFAVTSRDSFRVLDGATYAPRFTFVGFNEHDQLFATPSFCCSGSIGGLRNSAVVIGNDSHPLEQFASALVDPKRVRASAAGVKVEPAHVARPPKLAVVGSSELHVAANSTTIELDVEVEDELGFSGCEAEIDGRVLDRELSKAIVDVGPAPSSQRVHLAIVRDPKANESSLRIRIVSRSGVSSRPLRLRVVADG